MTTRRKGEYRHLELFDSRDWGLIIYDEVHLLPAPIFRLTADLQSRRRLGLTATLIREDGREGDVFSLIGPKRYDAPWKDIENQGWIAPADCTEVRVTLTDAERMAYATAEPEDRYKLAATARTKLPVIRTIVEQHPDDQVLVIGAYLDQLDDVSAELDGAPIIQGSTPNKERERLYDEFRRGEQRVLVVSKVANFSIDLPEAAVAVQISGTFGSRQEEAQRLGRVLRPKHDGRQAHFYTVVARDTLDAEYAAHRQRFLAEQGYAYTIVDADDLLRPGLPRPNGGQSFPPRQPLRAQGGSAAEPRARAAGEGGGTLPRGLRRVRGGGGGGAGPTGPPGPTGCGLVGVLVLPPGRGADRRPPPGVSFRLWGCPPFFGGFFLPFDRGLQLLPHEEDSLWANWDQDETAVESKYWEQEPATVAKELALAAVAILSSFAEVQGEQWQRTGRRSNGSVFTVDSFARYFMHDLVHHVHDVGG